nr:hypothetical protein [Tanacetum cinerariifolium]
MEMYSLMFMVQRELGLPYVYTKVGMLISLMMLMLMDSLFLKYQVFIEHPIDNSVMDTIDLEQEDANAGLGDENVGNVANDLGEENVEEFNLLFSYPYEEMYRFKINPCKDLNLWHLSNSHITYTPPEYHKPAGRPSKKRKKSSADLFDGLVKNGKISRFGQTITCCKCGKKGHNSITFKGQRGATFAPAVNQIQTTQTSVNPSTLAVNLSQTTQTTVNSPSQTSPTM